jgi:hypothetical protein
MLKEKVFFFTNGTLGSRSYSTGIINSYPCMCEGCNVMEEPNIFIFLSRPFLVPLRPPPHHNYSVMVSLDQIFRIEAKKISRPFCFVSFEANMNGAPLSQLIHSELSLS